MSHHVTHASVSAWIAAYLHAWETYEPADIGALFSENAEYRWHPADEPELGRAAIVEAWLNPGGDAGARDLPGTFVGELQPFVGNGNRAVAVGTCTYYTDASKSHVDRIYYNSWLLEFDEAGLCSSFTEYYMTPRKS